MTATAERWFGTHRMYCEQIMGLEALSRGAQGKTVLDLGCAEGEIGAAFLAAGAKLVHGAEIMIDRAEAARANLTLAFSCDLEYFREFYDVNRHKLLTRYDVVLALSIAHKLRRPDTFLHSCCNLAGQHLAVRLPTPILDDARSNHMGLDVRAHIEARGFTLETVPPTCRGEWLGIFRRVA